MPVKYYRRPYRRRAHLLDTADQLRRREACRVLTRIRILLMANNDDHTDAQIITALKTSESTVHSVRQRFVEEGLHDAIYDKPLHGNPPRSRFQPLNI